MPETQEKTSISKIIGDIILLMVESSNHQYLFINDLNYLLIPPLTFGQYHLFLDNEDKPIGVVFWAFVSPEVDKRLTKNLIKVAPHEWKSGDSLWLVDLISPKGLKKEMLEMLKNKIFPTTKIKVQQLQNDGSIGYAYL